jgi:hypothetical protein
VVNNYYFLKRHNALSLLMRNLLQSITPNSKEEAENCGLCYSCASALSSSSDVIIGEESPNTYSVLRVKKVAGNACHVLSAGTRGANSDEPIKFG